MPESKTFVRMDIENLFRVCYSKEKDSIKGGIRK